MRKVRIGEVTVDNCNIKRAVLDDETGDALRCWHRVDVVCTRVCAACHVERGACHQRDPRYGHTEFEKDTVATMVHCLANGGFLIGIFDEEVQPPTSET